MTDSSRPSSASTHRVWAQGGHGVHPHLATKVQWWKQRLDSASQNRAH